MPQWDWISACPGKVRYLEKKRRRKLVYLNNVIGQEFAEYYYISEMPSSEMTGYQRPAAELRYAFSPR